MLQVNSIIFKEGNRWYFQHEKGKTIFFKRRRGGKKGKCDNLYKLKRKRLCVFESGKSGKTQGKRE